MIAFFSPGVDPRKPWVHCPTCCASGKATCQYGEQPKHGWEPRSTCEVQAIYLQVQVKPRSTHLANLGHRVWAPGCTWSPDLSGQQTLAIKAKVQPGSQVYLIWPLELRLMPSPPNKNCGSTLSQLHEAFYQCLAFSLG